MMPCDYTTLNGRQETFDIDNVIDVVAGQSPKRENWTALVIYQIDKNIFIELRDSPQDVRGNSNSEAEEVTIDYIEQKYGINAKLLKKFKLTPSNWTFIDNRNN